MGGRGELYGPASPTAARAELHRVLDPYARGLERLFGESGPPLDAATPDELGLFVLEAPEP